MYDFTYTALASRVVFGLDSIKHVEREVELLGAGRALVLCTPEQTQQAEMVAGLLGRRCAGIHAGAVMHVPVDSAREAVALAARLGADCAVAIGGGSTVGLGKAIALESSSPLSPSPPPMRARR